MADQPTRRLDMPDDPIHTCPRCGGNRVWAETYTNGGFTIAREGALGILGGLARHKMTYCKILSCTKCGYLEWYALHPERLAE